jgi:hypothetical protein
VKTAKDFALISHFLAKIKKSCSAFTAEVAGNIDPTSEQDLWRCRNPAHDAKLF